MAPLSSLPMTYLENLWVLAPQLRVLWLRDSQGNLLLPQDTASIPLNLGLWLPPAY